MKSIVNAFAVLCLVVLLGCGEKGTVVTVRNALGGWRIDSLSLFDVNGVETSLGFEGVNAELVVRLVPGPYAIYATDSEGYYYYKTFNVTEDSLTVAIDYDTHLSLQQRILINIVYSIGDQETAARDAVIAVAGSGQAAVYFGHLVFDLNEICSARSALDNRIRTLLILEALETNPQNMRFNDNTAQAYQVLNRALAEKSYTMLNATQGLYYKNLDAHYSVRDNIAQAGYGKTWSELTTLQRQIINDWITSNDPPIRTGDHPHWGGSQSTLLTRARYIVGQSVDELVRLYFASYDEDSPILRTMASADELMNGRYINLSLSDVIASNIATIALGTGNSEECYRISAFFDPAKRSELEHFNVEMGALSGMGSAQLYGTMCSYAWISVFSEIAGKTGKTGSDLDMIYQAILSGDVSCISGIELEGDWANWARTGRSSRLERALSERSIVLDMPL